MKRIIITLFLTIGFAGCGYYSFTGATIPAHLETIAIPLVEDRSIGGPAGLNQQLTDLLIDRFAGRTRLTLVPDEEQADVVLYVEITRYSNDPAGVTGGRGGRAQSGEHRYPGAIRRSG